MVIGAESVANDCQQKSQIMERLYQNHISKCTSNIHQHKKKKTTVVCLKILQMKLAQQY